MTVAQMSRTLTDSHLSHNDGISLSTADYYFQSKIALILPKPNQFSTWKVNFIDMNGFFVT